MTWLLIGVVAFTVLLAILRWVIHRSLAPARVIEARTPASVGLPHQDAFIPTENNKTLFGWFIPKNLPGRSPAVVLLHGWGGNAETLLPLIRPLHEAGFALLLIDARCHGQSDEDSFASMPRFAEDLGHAIDWLKQREDIDQDALTAISPNGSVCSSATRGITPLPSRCVIKYVANAIEIVDHAHPVIRTRQSVSNCRANTASVG